VSGSSDESRRDSVCDAESDDGDGGDGGDDADGERGEGSGGDGERGEGSGGDDGERKDGDGDGADTGAPSTVALPVAASRSVGADTFRVAMPRSAPC
jgi:hypothetical protein